MKVAVLVVAYNAMETLSQVLDRIPAHVLERVSEIAVFDDASPDETYRSGLAYQARRGNAKLHVYRNERNLGYGGNQKRGYTYCLTKGYDAVVLLHGDGQYAPEVMGDLLDALEQENADAVFGSRMMHPGAARRGGMPLYKYVGNRILSWFENRLLGLNLTEYHSGYRVYRCSALAGVPYALNTDDFHFDTQIIIQFRERGLRIVERPIPTYYGDEICYVNGLKYAWNVCGSVIRYRLHKLGLIYEPRYDVNPQKYGFHATKRSSHGQILSLVPPETRVLDVGCGEAHQAARLREQGCFVVGLDRRVTDWTRANYDRVYECDVEAPWPEEAVAQPYDVVILADILEHLRSPESALAQARNLLRAGGQLLVSAPNVAHLYVRLNLLFGRFEYAERGIMDHDHLRFFTGTSLCRTIRAAGFRLVHRSVTPVPFASLYPPGRAPWFARCAESAAYGLARVFPGLFAYQYVVAAEVGPTPAEELPPGISDADD